MFGYKKSSDQRGERDRSNKEYRESEQSKDIRNSRENRPARDSRSTRENREKGRTRTVSSANLKITFENIISTLRSSNTNELDKESVIACFKSVYEWMVHDPDAQIDMPVPCGSTSTVKMWPHGAVVNTRPDSSDAVIDRGSKVLEDLDKSIAVSVAKSVVSSTIDEEELMAPRGRIVTSDNPRKFHAVEYTDRSNFIQYNPLDEPYKQGMPPITNSLRYNMESAQGIPYSRKIDKTIPRYSILGNAMRPARVAETPEIPKAQMANDDATREQQTETTLPRRKKQPRVGAGKRSDNDTGEGIPVTFED